MHSRTPQNIITYAGAIAVTSGQFIAGNSPLLNGVHCNGAESSLLECTYSNDSTCGRREDAAVVCQGVCVCMHVYMHIMCLCGY